MTSTPPRDVPPTPYGPPPYGQYPPPPPPRKRRVWPWVLGGVVAVFAAIFTGCSLMVGGAVHEMAKQEDTLADVQPAGTEVQDGKFSFLVTGIGPPTPSLGANPYPASDAQGEYRLVHVDITNIGSEPQSYFGENQKLIDDQGRVYTNDTGAEPNVNPAQSAEINPGNKVSATLVFDVPPGTVPTAVELHDSMFSGGVRVATT